MNMETVVPVGAFLGVTLLMFFVLRRRGRDSRIDERMRGLSVEHRQFLQEQIVRDQKKAFWNKQFQRWGTLLLADHETTRTRIRARLIRAGIYSTSALPTLMSVKLILMTLPALLGSILGWSTLVPLKQGIILGCLASAWGMMMPSFWLESRTKKFHNTIRRSLPDFLDLMVACLESGMTMESSIFRVGSELETAHPVLAREMMIVKREIELGRMPDAALKNFSERSDLDCIRTLAVFIEQARQFGTSTAHALRTHADMLRQQIEQRAEEMAQKAAVKILAPTLLFIFPPIFAVVAGPAVMELHEKLSPDAAESRKASS